MSANGKRKINSNGVIVFCARELLKMMERGMHFEPYIALRSAIRDKYMSVDEERAQNIAGLVLNAVSDGFGGDKVIIYSQCRIRGSYWRLDGNNLKVRDLANRIEAKCGEAVEEYLTYSY